MQRVPAQMDGQASCVKLHPVPIEDVPMMKEHAFLQLLVLTIVANVHPDILVQIVKFFHVLCLTQGSANVSMMDIVNMSAIRTLSVCAKMIGSEITVNFVTALGCSCGKECIARQ